MYEVSILHPEWGHSLMHYSNKSKAIRKASYVRSHGCFFSDELKKTVLEQCSIMVYKDNNYVIYIKPFTKKYLSFRKDI